MPRKVRLTNKVEERESGILAVKTQMEVQEPFYVKEEGKNCVVVNSNGEVQRVYRADSCENPKACAESYANKLSSRWR